MLVNIGSANPVKIKAVEEIVADYEFLQKAQVNSISVESQVAEQPLTLEETIAGAKNRATNAFDNCKFSFGIEDGLMPLPLSLSGYMNVCVCVVYDGKQYYTGLSSAFEYPKAITDLIFKEKLDVSQAFLQSGLSETPDLGKKNGAIGILTKNRLTRKDYTKQALVTALIHLEKNY